MLSSDIAVCQHYDVSFFEQALQFGFLDFSNFDVEEYEHFEVNISPLLVQ